MVILGISIGTRSSGIAILDNGSLMAWNTLSFKDAWSEKKAERIVAKYEAYLRGHGVTMVVLKIPPFSHQTAAVLTLIKKIQGIVVYHGCMVEYKTKQDIKLAVPEVRNTHAIMEHATTLYPALAESLAREKASRNQYHSRMFEAVMVAHLCSEQPPKKRLTGKA